MPRRPSKNVVQKYIEFPPDFLKQFQALADANGRSFKEEIMDAMARHMAAPPIFRVETPPLPESVIERPVEPNGQTPVDPPPERVKAKKGKGKAT